MSKIESKSYRMTKKDRIINCFLWLFQFAVTSVMALQLNIPIVIDEVGTMANTVSSVGLDWTETVFAMGNYYYKPGLAILYIPLFKLIKSPAVLYKTIMLLHMAILAFIPVICCTIIKKYLKSVNEILTVMISCITGLIPSVILYSMYARSDIMLIFIPWVIAFLLLEIRNASKLKRIIFSVLLSIVSVYAYMVHTRGLIVIIALILTIVFISVYERRVYVHLLSFIPVTLIMLLVDKIVSVQYKYAVYLSGTEHASAESFEWSYLKLIFTGRGFASFIKLIVGWLYNVFVSSYGLVGIGLIGCISVIVYAFKKRSSLRDNELVIAVYGILQFLGSFAMGCLFFFPSADRFFKNEFLDCSDRLIYGRYMACSLGIIIFLALYFCISRKGYLKFGAFFVNAGIFLLVAWGFLQFVVKYIPLSQARSRYFITLCTFLKIENPGSTTAVFENIDTALRISGFIAFIIYIVFMLITDNFRIEKGRRKQLLDIRFVYGALILLFISNAIILGVNFTKVRYSRDTLLTTNTSEVSEFVSSLPDMTKSYPEVLCLSSATGVRFYQYNLPKYKVGCFASSAGISDNCLIIAKKSTFLKQFYNDDYYLFDSFDYEGTTRDIVYVKGEKLVEYLTTNGISLTKYDGKLKKTNETLEKLRK